jgi:hypothetical protein
LSANTSFMSSIDAFGLWAVVESCLKKSIFPFFICYTWSVWNSAPCIIQNCVLEENLAHYSVITLQHAPDYISTRICCYVNVPPHLRETKLCWKRKSDEDQLHHHKQTEGSS